MVPVASPFEDSGCDANGVSASGWFVDEADCRADDDPLKEAGDALIKGELEANVEVHVVVDDEDADREYADECAKRGAGSDAAVSGIDFCEENGHDYDADEDGDHTVGHHLHHLALWPIDVGVLHQFAFMEGNAANMTKPETK